MALQRALAAMAYLSGTVLCLALVKISSSKQSIPLSYPLVGFSASNVNRYRKPSGPKFDDLDPTVGNRVKRNENALALIVGFSDYKRTEAPAIYADKDAQYFHDYASLKLGIPDSNITTMINEKAEQGDVYLAVAD